VDVLFVLAIVLSGLAAGAAVNSVLAMIPALRSLDAATLLEVRHAASPLPSLLTVALAAGAGLAGAALLAFYGSLDSDAQVLVAVAVGLSAMLLAAGWFGMHLELSLSHPGREVPPERHLTLARRWEYAQLLMSAASFGALACYASGAASVS
jgi:hypothetical protein